jgi:hypothetical protein
MRTTCLFHLIPPHLDCSKNIRLETQIMNLHFTQFSSIPFIAILSNFLGVSSNQVTDPVEASKFWNFVHFISFAFGWLTQQ